MKLRKVVVHLRWSHFHVNEYRENALDLIILCQVALEKRHAIFVLLQKVCFKHVEV